MEKLSRNNRVVAITKILIETPNKVIGLNRFSELLNAAKSTISEDIVIVREVLEKLEMGSIETISGAAGGIKFIPAMGQKAREEFANEQRFENVDEVYSGDIPNIIKNISINDNTYIVIATRGYEGDLISLRSVIDRNPMYIGMIGSMKKWIKVKETLINENINIEKLESVYAPVGINISSNSVDEIAFGIMAEILLVKNNGSLTHRKNKIK